MIQLKQGLCKIGLGSELGLAGALMVSGSVTSLLAGVKPTDPLVYGWSPSC